MDVVGPSGVEQTLDGPRSVFSGHDLMLGPLAAVAVAQRLDEVPVLSAAVGAGQAVTVVAEEVEPLMRHQQRLCAAVTLKQDKDRLLRIFRAFKKTKTK